MTERRAYNSPVRRQQVAETRERIVSSGSDLVHGFESWDWRALTVRAVAERAGVSERTVYRHFADERELRDGVMGRIYEESGVALEGLTVEGFGDVTARVYDYLASFAVHPRTLRDPTFVDLDERRREALLAAVRASTDGWSDDDRTIAAAVLDVMWNVPTYERLRSAWDLDADRASSAAAWVVGLVERAVRDGDRPPS